MAFNSSSSSNTSLLAPPLSSSNSSLSSPSNCLKYSSSFFIFTAFAVASIILLLPVCLSVFCLGLRRWRGSRASSASHSDVFAYHMVAMEMFGVIGCVFYCCGACFGVPWLMNSGAYLFSVTSNGQVFFHILTCVERHLAVVHPITYMRLRNRGGVKIRNISIGLVWLFFWGFLGLNKVILNSGTVPAFCLSVLSMLAVSFCSLSVLHVLIRPGPGDGGKDRERVDQSKKRAFYSIMAIMGALLFRFWGHLLVLGIHASSALSERVRCGVLVSGVWYGLPSSLVLPLLFLHRAGKLLCCWSGKDSGSE